MLYAQYQVLLCDNYTKENLYIKIVTLFHKSKTRKEPDFLINKINYEKKRCDNSAVLREKENLEQLHVHVLIISKLCKCSGMLHE